MGDGDNFPTYEWHLRALYLQRSQISLQHGRVRKKLSPCVFALSPLSLILSSSLPPHFPLNLTKCAYINTRQLHVAAAAARMCNAALSFNASFELYARMPSFLTAQSSHVKAGIAQSCKKISDLYLKDRDHLIDLDLLCDLDHCW